MADDQRRVEAAASELVDHVWAANKIAGAVLAAADAWDGENGWTRVSSDVVEQVWTMHSPEYDPIAKHEFCRECNQAWPCNTRSALAAVGAQGEAQ